MLGSIVPKSLVALGAAAAASAVLFLAAGPAAAVPPSFSATPTTVSVGDSVTVASITDCPAPQGAGDWVAIVNVAQGANPQLSFENYLIQQDGSWGGSITMPNTLALGAAQLTAKCFDAQHHVENETDYASIDLTVIAAPTSSSASTATTSPVTSSAATSPSSSTGPLANTGFDSGPIATLGLVVLLAGGGLVVFARPSRMAKRH